MRKEEDKLGLANIIVTVVAIAVSAITLIPPYNDYIKNNGDTLLPLYQRFIDSFSTFGMALTYIIWIIFLTIYGVLILYERRNPDENLINKEKYKTNHSFNLWKLGVSAIFVQHVTYVFDNIAPITSTPYPLPSALFSIIIAIYGLYWLINGRVDIDGYWNPDIIKFPGQRIIDKGTYSRTRHPIYTGQIAITISIFIACYNWWLLYLPILTIAQSIRRALLEERALLELFPEEYSKYKEEVPSFMHIPLVEWND